jgi:hypothetical protein
MDHQWVRVQVDRIICRDIPIRDHRLLVISRVTGMDQDLMALLDHQGDPMGLEVHLNRDHQVLDLVSIDRQACSSTEDLQGLLDKDLLVVPLDIQVDHQVIQEVLHLVQNGIDHQVCIMDHKDHQVLININICKDHNQDKAHHKGVHHKEEWVVCYQAQVVHHQGMADLHKDLPKGRPAVQLLT